MDILVLSKIHSTSARITSSSTDIFVIEEHSNIDIVTDIVKNLWVEYNSTLTIPYPIDISTILTIKKARKSEAEILFSTGRKNVYEMYSVGDIIIEGTRDNSIPYDFMMIIVDILCATHYHLG
jgi:hypothetical protein